MRLRSSKPARSDKGESGLCRNDHLGHQFPDLAAVGSGVVLRQSPRRSQGLEPPRALLLRTQLLTPQEIRFAQYADDASIGIDDRQCADIVIDQQPCSPGNVIIRTDGDYVTP